MPNKYIIHNGLHYLGQWIGDHWIYSLMIGGYGVEWYTETDFNKMIGTK